WPIGVGLAIDWTLGYPPCPYWGYWGCPVTPYAAVWPGYWGAGYWGPYPATYWGPAWAGYWGPGYAWAPTYAWDAVYLSGPGFVGGVGYDWVDDWQPVVYAPAAPAVEYAVLSTDTAWSPTYVYADYSPGACVGRRYLWDDELGGYVLRPVHYPC